MLRRSVVLLLLSDCRAAASRHDAVWWNWRTPAKSRWLARHPLSHPSRTFLKPASGDSAAAMPPKPSSAAGAAAANSKLPADFAKKIQPIYDAIDSKSAQPSSALNHPLTRRYPWRVPAIYSAYRCNGLLIPSSLSLSVFAVSASNLKSALKLLSTSMSKYGRRPVLLALLALTHARLDQRQEAFATCEEVAASHPTDTHILHTLSLVYRQLDFPHLVPPLYEQALAALPTAPASPPPEELLLAMFYAYAAQHAYTQAQSTAIKLYTHYKHTHYLYYSATTQLLRFALPSLLHPPPPTPNKLLTALLRHAPTRTAHHSESTPGRRGAAGAAAVAGRGGREGWRAVGGR